MSNAKTQQTTVAVATNACRLHDGYYLLWTRSDIANILACSTRTVSRMLSIREIPAPIVLARMPRWRPNDIRLWIARRCPSQDHSAVLVHPFFARVARDEQEEPPSDDAAALDFDRLWARRDLAQRLQCSPRTISRLTMARLMPPPLKSRRLPRWHPSDIVAWISQGCPPMDRYQVRR